MFEPGALSRLGKNGSVDKAGCLRADMGDNQLAVVYDARGNGDGVVANTITGDHENRVTNYTAIVLNERHHSLTVGKDVANTLTGTDFKGVQCVFEPKAYGISSYMSNSMLSDNPHAGIYEADTARTLDTNANNPGANQGGIAVVADRHPVCYQDNVGSLFASDYKFPQQQQIVEGKAVVEQITLENRYVVRRLTPTECALLQGFPPDWCAGLETPKPTKEDISFWRKVWETHRRIMGESSTPKSRSQIVKWLKNPHSDAAEYKMWGNGVALPNVVFVLGGIAHFS